MSARTGLRETLCAQSGKRDRTSDVGRRASTRLPYFLLCRSCAAGNSGEMKRGMPTKESGRGRSDSHRGSSTRRAARAEHEAIIRIQRAAGNAAVADLLGHYGLPAVQRQADAGAAGATTGVEAGRFFNTGTSRLGQTLGFRSSGPYFVNGVEIVFALQPGARGRYRELRPRQWSGPEGVFVKTGQPLGSPWRTMSRGPGAGPDDPEPKCAG